MYYSQPQARSHTSSYYTGLTNRHKQSPLRRHYRGYYYPQRKYHSYYKRYGGPYLSRRFRDLYGRGFYRDYYGNAYNPHGYGQGYYSKDYGNGLNGENYGCPFYRDYFAYYRNNYPPFPVGLDQMAYMSRPLPAYLSDPTYFNECNNNSNIHGNNINCTNYNMSSYQIGNDSSAFSSNINLFYETVNSKLNQSRVDLKDRDNHLLVYNDNRSNKNKHQDTSSKNIQVKYFRCKKTTPKKSTSFRRHTKSGDVYYEFSSRKSNDDVYNDRLQDIVCQFMSLNPDEKKSVPKNHDGRERTTESYYTKSDFGTKSGRNIPKSGRKHSSKFRSDAWRDKPSSGNKIRYRNRDHYSKGYKHHNKNDSLHNEQLLRDFLRYYGSKKNKQNMPVSRDNAGKDGRYNYREKDESRVRLEDESYDYVPDLHENAGKDGSIYSNREYDQSHIRLNDESYDYVSVSHDNIRKDKGLYNYKENDKSHEGLRDESNYYTNKRTSDQYGHTIYPGISRNNSEYEYTHGEYYPESDSRVKFGHNYQNPHEHSSKLGTDNNYPYTADTVTYNRNGEMFGYPDKHYAKSGWFQNGRNEPFREDMHYYENQKDSQKLPEIETTGVDREFHYYRNNDKSHRIFRDESYQNGNRRTSNTYTSTVFPDLDSKSYEHENFQDEDMDYLTDPYFDDTNLFKRIIPTGESLPKKYKTF